MHNKKYKKKKSACENEKESKHKHIVVANLALAHQ